MENNHPNTEFVTASPVIVRGIANTQAKPSRTETTMILKAVVFALFSSALLLRSFDKILQNLDEKRAENVLKS